METKNNSDFLSKVNAFQEEMQEFIKKSDGKHAVIIIASEPNENGKDSCQTGSTLGNECELVMALSGFMKQPQMRDLLKKAAMLSVIASASRLSEILNPTSNENEQEEGK